MPATLYSLSLSHPSQAARLMLERKGIEHEVVDLLPGMHPWTVRLRGFRRWIARDVVGMPAPALMAELNLPIARRLASMVGARDESVRAALAQLPLLLDHVDSLIAEGTIGGGEPNAADFQIGTTIRVFLGYDDLRERVAPRPCGELAMRVLPDYPGPIPSFLPKERL